MDKPLVSIVICCYNRKPFLPATMKSVFSQKYSPVEILIIDDGSTDGTGDLIKAYGEKVRYFRHENRGIAATRTVGCKLAKGDYIAFQDDDDLMVPERIDLLLSALLEHPKAVLALGDYAFIDKDGMATGEKSKFVIHDDYTEPITEPIVLADGYTSILWPLVTPLPHTTLFRKSDAKKIGWFDESFFHACSDTDFFARLGKLGPIVYVPELVSYYRSGHSAIWAKKLASEYSRLLLFEKHLKRRDQGRPGLEKILKQRLLHTLKRIALYQSLYKDELSEVSIHEDRALSLLDLSDAISYRLYKWLKLPIRNLIVGANTEN